MTSESPPFLDSGYVFGRGTGADTGERTVGEPPVNWSEAVRLGRLFDDDVCVCVDIILGRQLVLGVYTDDISKPINYTPN